MNATSYTQVEFFSSPSARVVELVKRLREHKEQGLAKMHEELKAQ